MRFCPALVAGSPTWSKEPPTYQQESFVFLTFGLKQPDPIRTEAWWQATMGCHGGTPSHPFVHAGQPCHGIASLHAVLCPPNSKSFGISNSPAGFECLPTCFSVHPAPNYPSLTRDHFKANLKVPSRIHPAWSNHLRSVALGNMILLVWLSIVPHCMIRSKSDGELSSLRNSRFDIVSLGVVRHGTKRTQI